MQAQIIDIHPHVISADLVRYPVTPLSGKEPGWSAERRVSFEQMISAMDEAGVAKAALVHTSTYGYDDTYVADCVAALSDRFTGVFSVDVLAPDAVEKIRYWHARKLSGLRMLAAHSALAGQADTFADERSFPAWECCAELGIPVCVQLRSGGLPQLMAPQLTAIAKRFPRVRIILDHLLKPPLAEGPPYSGSQFLFDLARHDNIYLKLSTNNIRAVRNGKASAATFFPRLVAEFGASRIAWGSNCPASRGTLSEMANEARSALASLSPEDQHWIFCRTAQTLYPALKDQ